MQSFQDSSQTYIQWLDTKLRLEDTVDKVVKKRETTLSESTPFKFLRGTFYRWVQLWTETCPELDKAPDVLGVGDLHIENFGTWRDVEGRLVWGINDFDECCFLPYTNDLVRLATSAYFAVQEFRQKEDPEADIEQEFSFLCQDIIGGYCTALGLADHATNGEFLGFKPIILSEDNDWLREIVIKKLREKDAVKDEDPDDDFDEFFQEMKNLEIVNLSQDKPAWKAINQTMPEMGLSFRIGKRDAGLGSLGRERFTAVVDNWHGAIVVREAKAIAPSAWFWAKGEENSNDIFYEKILHDAIRATDPWLKIYHLGERENWVVRRLVADSLKVKLKDVIKGKEPEKAKKDLEKLWRAMGRETANVHIAIAQSDVPKDVTKRNQNNPEWLADAAKKMAEVTIKDREE